MEEFLISLASFIVLMAIMVVVHELGHFTVAKLFGIRVESFSIGFGPRLFGFKRGETLYKVCLLPLGGYVKMTAETPAAGESANHPGAFSAHPRWQRILVGLGGPAANFILAFTIMTFYFGWINEVPAYDLGTKTVEWVMPGTAAEQAGIEPGDIIRHFDTIESPGWQQVYVRMSHDLNQAVPLVVERNGKTVQLTIQVPSKLDGDLAGILPQYLSGPIEIADVAPGSPAAKAGLRSGDAIESADGHPFHAFSALLAYLQAENGKPVSLIVVRQNSAPNSVVVLPAKVEDSWVLGFVTAPIATRRAPLRLTRALSKAKQFCMQGSTLIVEMLKQVATHKVSAMQLSGPVGIARMAGEAAEMKGWYSKFYMAAEISMNLGIINLLPFPILDGWLILLLLIESVLRHNINRVVKERAYQAGLALLLFFFGFIMVSDVSKLPMFSNMLK